MTTDEMCRILTMEIARPSSLCSIFWSRLRVLCSDSLAVVFSDEFESVVHDDGNRG